MASGTSKTPEGRPDFLLQQVPVRENTDLELSRPQIYFGEGLGGYAITQATRDALAYQIGSETQLTRYDGGDGAGRGSYLPRGGDGRTEGGGRGWWSGEGLVE